MQIDKQKFADDLEKVMTEHGLTSGVFLSSIKNKKDKDCVFILAYNEDKTWENDMCNAVSGLFSQIQLSPKQLNSVTSLVRQYVVHARQEKKDAKKNIESIAASKLSVADKALLEQYRKLKHDYILKKDYENASKYRDIELKLLKIKY